MKLCTACKGSGEINYEVCFRCDGEGVDTVGTFTVGKTQRRKKSELELNVEEKKVKFDKKNAVRLI